MPGKPAGCRHQSSSLTGESLRTSHCAFLPSCTKCSSPLGAHHRPAGLMGFDLPGGFTFSDPKTSSLLWSAMFFKNIRDTKGTFHVKMGSIKDRNSMDPTEGKGLIRGV